MKASAYVEIDGGTDLDFGGVAACKNYLITTEHSASSYGLPVAVDRHTGEVVGPSEIEGMLDVVGSDDLDGITRQEIVDALIKAGYSARPMGWK
jgi:hypothetical protein